MRGHAYQNPRCVTTHKVTTAYGTFHLCASCVLERHAGIKFGNVPERIPTTERPRPCECEHVSHVFQQAAES